MDRISTAQLYERGINSMLERQLELSKTQTQISTGKRILSPKDDPAGAAYALSLKGVISQVEQYQDNADRVKARLDLQEATLQAVDNILPRIQELTVQGLSDTYSASDRQAIAEEMRKLNDELMALANTRDSNGEYIFAGFDANGVPFTNPADGVFTYEGDMGTRMLRISATRQIQDRENGYDVFMNIDTSTGGKRSLFETVHGIIAGMEADAPDATYLEDLRLAQTHNVAIRARGGASLNTVEEQILVNEDYVFTMKTTLSNTEDLDMAEAISRFELEKTALEAAQQTFNMVQNLSLFNYL